MICRTLSIIKPDAVRKNKIGAILSRFEQDGLKIIAANMFTMSPEQAGKFYDAHAERPFYQSLVDFLHRNYNFLYSQEDVAKATNDLNVFLI